VHCNLSWAICCKSVVGAGDSSKLVAPFTPLPGHFKCAQLAELPGGICKCKRSELVAPRTFRTALGKGHWMEWVGVQEQFHHHPRVIENTPPRGNSKHMKITHK